MLTKNGGGGLFALLSLMLTNMRTVRCDGDKVGEVFLLEVDFGVLVEVDIDRRSNANSRDEVEVLRKRVNGNKGEDWVAKPVWTNANRVNHANHFVPRLLQLNAGRRNVNSVRPNVNTGRVNVNSVRHTVNSVRTYVNTGRTEQPVPTCNSKSFSPVRP
ncbi:hypothetical protein Tco_0553395 [Tanacetum coccineum]